MSREGEGLFRNLFIGQWRIAVILFVCLAVGELFLDGLILECYFYIISQISLKVPMYFY